MRIKTFFLSYACCSVAAFTNANTVCENRVEEITRAEFQYETSDSVGLSAVIPSMCDTATELGADYYAVAIMTMLVAMNSLGVNDSNIEIKREIEDFIKVNSREVLRLARERGNQPMEDIENLLSGIVSKHGLPMPN